MSTPLTDSINALTTYANEVTGGSDTNLSDAVHTLASGYGGGASNIVTGTFKGTTTGAAMDVTLNYSGSGYPIAVMIYPSSANESTFQSTIQRYAVRDYVLEKDAKATSPTYSKTGNGDSASFMARYKNSSSSSASYSNGGSTAALYADEAARDAFNAIIKIRSKTKMSVFIASSSYGFMANIEYSYVVIYYSS